MTYTVNWFKITAKENFERYVLPRFGGKPNLKFLEIGCFEGMATRWLLDNVLTHQSSVVTVIDTFEGSAEHQGNQELKLATLYERFCENVGDRISQVEIRKGLSNRELRYLYSKYAWGNYDFIYVDGSHRADDALQDIVLSFDLLKPGGLMIWDDYGWNNFSDHLNACIAMDAFLNCYVGKYVLLLKEYQIVIEKV